ncbi:hypothetical protein D3C79_737560 [compost metagenome]
MRCKCCCTYTERLANCTSLVGVPVITLSFRPHTQVVTSCCGVADARQGLVVCDVLVKCCLNNLDTSVSFESSRPVCAVKGVDWVFVCVSQDTFINDPV